MLAALTSSHASHVTPLWASQWCGGSSLSHLNLSDFLFCPYPIKISAFKAAWDYIGFIWITQDTLSSWSQQLSKRIYGCRVPFALLGNIFTNMIIRSKGAQDSIYYNDTKYTVYQKRPFTYELKKIIILYKRLRV